MILPVISAAEAGRYDSSRTQYLREILTNLSVMSPVMSTILMKGSQIGASQAGLAFVLYIIAVGGGPAIVICPTIAMAELYSKQRLDPLIAECEEARAKVPLNKGKNSGNTLTSTASRGRFPYASRTASRPGSSTPRDTVP